jgi:hypothetical protein
MGWHDVTVHAFALVPEQFELLLDIDYILKWEEPEPPEVHYTFWISPATLVFKGVQDIKISFDIDNIQDIDLQGIKRECAVPAPSRELVDWSWIIEANQGTLRFRATGYKQYFRRGPIRMKEQSLDVRQRGGLSFERVELPV